MSRVESKLDLIKQGFTTRESIVKEIGRRKDEAGKKSLQRALTLLDNLAFVEDLKPEPMRGYKDFTVLFTPETDVQVDHVNVKVRSSARGVESLLKSKGYGQKDRVSNRLIILNIERGTSDYEVISAFIDGVKSLEPQFVAPAPLLKSLKK